MEKIISGGRDEVVKTYYELVAVVTRAVARSDKSPITPTEVSILSIIAAHNRQALLTKGVRGKIQRALNLSPAALSNHLRRMKDKKLLIEEAGDLRTNPRIVPSGSDVFKVTLHETQ